MTSSKRVSELYDQTCKGYETRYKEIQIRKFINILKNVQFSENEIIVDLGCGTGLLKEFLPKDVRYIGLDISRGMLSLARRRDSRYVRGNIEALPFKENIFDKIFCVTVLQNVSNTIKSLKEISRISKKNSEIFISFLKKKKIEKFEKILHEVGMTKIKTINDPKCEDKIFILRNI